MTVMHLWTLVFNATMIAFAVLLFWVAYDHRVHTGFLGALGAAGGGIQALRSMDDSVLHTVDGTRSTMMIFVWCMFLLVGNVVYSLWRAGAFGKQGTEESPSLLSVQPAAAKAKAHPWRRRSDFGEFADAPEHHNDQRSAA